MLQAKGSGLVLTHGAGGNCNSPLLMAVADVFTAAGATVLRYDLPFRQRRPFGPPSPSTAAADREGLAEMVGRMGQRVQGKVFLGGHSYGGRQASMLAAEQPGLIDGLLLLSYPLHPPNKPQQLRTAHFGMLKTPAWFVHGTKDPFGTVEELATAIASIPAENRLAVVEGAAHDLKKKGPDPFSILRLILVGRDQSEPPRPHI